MKAARAKVIEYFDKRAKVRDKDYQTSPTLGYEQKRRQEIVFRFLNAQNKDVILDVGCGNGRDLTELVKVRCQLVGIDISPRMIQEAKHKCKKAKINSKISLILGDATSLPIKGQAFDKLICSETLEHIPKWESAVKEIARVLKTGGVTIVSTPNIYSLAGLYRKLYEKILRKNWWHPYDDWKNFRILSEELNKERLLVKGFAAAVFLPAIILSMIPLSTKLLPIIDHFERKLRSYGPLKYLGYMIIVKAIKV